MKTKNTKSARKFTKPTIVKREKISGCSGPCGRSCCATCGSLVWSS